jgi:CRP/FNR family cyclic AMP-dependent transcriptional regulator
MAAPHPELRPCRVFEVDPDLVVDLGSRQAASARRRATAAVIPLDCGPCPLQDWYPESAQNLGLLVIEGVLVREVSLGGKISPELIGAGDLLRPWDHNDNGMPVEPEVEWTVLQPARLAVLDAHFAQLTRPWPEVTARLLSRAVRRTFSLALQRALLSHPSVEMRLSMLFCHLAERWGEVGRDGSVRLPLALTHEMLAKLIGQSRPYVTGALSQLSEKGLITRREGDWILSEALGASLVPG